MSSVKDLLKYFLKALLTALLFLGTQTISIVGFMGPMIAPLLFFALTVPQPAWFNFYWIWQINNANLFIEAIFYIGVVIFILALVQWFWYHHKKVGLFSKGLYSKVRHPQFLGIIIMAMGLTMKEGGGICWVLLVPFLNDISVHLNQLVGLWFLATLGYIFFAWYEERNMSKKFSEFKEYKQKVPFLLPIKNPKIIPEVIFTVILVLGICLILLELPYDFIVVNSYKYIPNFQFP